MVFGREAGGEVYRLVRTALGLLDDGMSTDPLLRSFELHLLGVSGYGPALDRCHGCGTPTGDGRPVYLARERGGVVCRPCVHPGEPVQPIDPGTVRELVRLAAEPLARATPGDGAILTGETARVLEHLIARVVAGPIRSRAFLARARVDSAAVLR
jgi:DNA repair protein RecO